MAKTQPQVIAPPSAELQDHAANVQLNFEQVFQDLHEHRSLTSPPNANAGSVQDMSIVDDGTSVYVVVKTPRGWFKSSTFTAL